MRIVGGKHKGRRLAAPDGLAVRPTADRTREALFNILEGGRLGPALRGARVLDAFAGTGALGLEALSRGAEELIFIETLPAAIAALKRNIESLSEGRRCEVLRADVLHPPRSEAPAGIVLMDPPYGQGLAAPAVEALAASGWIGRESLVVVELMSRESLQTPAGFELAEERRYGKARLAFLRRSSPASG